MSRRRQHLLKPQLPTDGVGEDLHLLEDRHWNKNFAEVAGGQRQDLALGPQIVDQDVGIDDKRPATAHAQAAPTDSSFQEAAHSLSSISERSRISAPLARLIVPAVSKTAAWSADQGVGLWP